MIRKYCIICGKKLSEKRIKQGKDTCCHSCSAKSMNRKRWSNEDYRQKMSNKMKEARSNEELRQKMSNKMKEVWSNEDYKQKTSSKMKEAWSNEELKQKMSEKFKAIWSNEELRQKMSEKQKDIWSNEDYKQKMSEKFKAIWSNEELKQKMSESVSRALASPEVRQKLSNSIKKAYELNGNEIKMKQTTTKRVNGTMKYSKAEKSILKLLQSKFKEVYYQYDKDERYPFRCDFYLPSLDIFIEYNGNWTHGGAPYNKNEQWCIEQLNAWKEKAINSEYYESAISVWTYWDIKKMTIAKLNNLNFKVFYTMEQFNQWYKEIQ